MLARFSQSALLSRSVPPERTAAGPLRGTAPSLAAAILTAVAIFAPASANAQGVPGGLEVASRSAHRTAPRFPSADEGAAVQADHQTALGDDGRGYVQPAQYVPRSRMMQNRMMARGGMTTMGSSMYGGDVSTSGEVVYEGTDSAMMGDVSEGEVIYEGDFPPGMVPQGGRMMGGGNVGRGGMFRGGMGGGLLGRGGMMGRGAVGGGGMGCSSCGGMGCDSCGGTAPVWSDGPACGCEGGYDMGGGCGNGCDMGCGGGCGGCNGCCLLFNPKTNVEAFAGAHAFRGISNLDSSGSFGFYEGFLLSGPVPCVPGEAISWEFGGMFSQTDFEGSPYTENQRTQAFGTAGLFRRVDWGLQGGAVLDFMNDNWYATSNLVQIRGELGWVYPSGHELGVWATHGISQSGDTANVTFQGVPLSGQVSSTPIDLYCVYFRRTFCEGGDGRIFGGVTDNSQAVVGADFRVPVTCNWGLQGGFTYLIPSSEYDRTNTGSLRFQDVPEDAWNINVGVVWSFGGRMRDKCNYHRALLPVANNGTFFMDRRLTN